MLELHWSTAPFFVRVFFLYLSLVLIWAVIRGLRITRRLFSVSRKRTSIDDIQDEAICPQVLAEAAFGNRIRFEPISFVAGTLDKSRTIQGDQAILRALQMADVKFRSIWGNSKIQIAEIKRLLWLTSLLSSFAFVSSAFPTWREFFHNSKLTAFGALLEAIPRLFDWVSLAFLACAILYTIWAFLDGTLRRRQVCWEHFYSRATKELLAESWNPDSSEPASKGK